MAVKSNVSNSEKSAQPDALEVRTIAGLSYQKNTKPGQETQAGVVESGGKKTQKKLESLHEKGKIGQAQFSICVKTFIL